MPEVVVYRGSAGTGKTWNLFERLKSEIAKRDWGEHESVLALTFMHGARRRLDERLRLLQRRSNVRFKCTTIDSFAVNLVNKFRTHLDYHQKISVNADKAYPGQIELNEDEIAFPLEKIQLDAISLLAKPSIQRYVKNSYPIIIIDEFQDCHGSLLNLIKSLTFTKLILALDPFQQLLTTPFSDANDWIDSQDFEVNPLSTYHRTNNSKLLNTASALRSGGKNLHPKIFVQACPGSKNVASSFITKSIFYALVNRAGSIAIITPSTSSNFVQGALTGMQKAYKLNGQLVGPYSSMISMDERTKVEEIAPHLLSRPIEKGELESILKDPQLLIRKSAEVALRKLSLRNMTEIGSEEFGSILNQSAHLIDNFLRRPRQGKITFSTIHGAKNKEFDHVIILWPYQIAGDAFFKRKLLYNAVTRAKKSAVLLVQNSNFELSSLAKDPVISLIL